jgi:hypothetical protein
VERVEDLVLEEDDVVIAIHSELIEDMECKLTEPFAECNHAEVDHGALELWSVLNDEAWVKLSEQQECGYDLDECELLVIDIGF